MKFHSIRIQNYKSINDITLYLSDVNLLIGPNNSGKSNILGALKLFSDYVYYLHYKDFPADSDFNKRISFVKDKKSGVVFESDFTKFTLIFFVDTLDFNYYTLHISMKDTKNIDQLFRIADESKVELSNWRDTLDKSEYLEVDGFNIDNQKKFFSRTPSQLFTQRDVQTYNRFNHNYAGMIQNFASSLAGEFSDSSIYSIQVEKLKAPARLTANEESVLSDGSNLVSFIDSMRDTNPKIIREIEKDLFRFTKEFESIRLIKVTGDSTTEATFKKLGLADKEDNTFWSDQLSEGVLYFLALLAIIHQPNPPHLLMLEEPEKGIHPRRIKEIIELIFQIAKDKGIRIILTTHSTYVVDQFTEFPEGVHIVDKIDKSTQVKNLKRDFIDKEEGREDKIDYLSSLGEHWAIGFLGGVPE